MIHLFINALAATAGGGLTYVRNILPRLAVRDDVHATILVDDTLFNEVKGSASVAVLRAELPSTARRFWYEQRALPALIRNSGAGALLSAGNFALYKSPVPQILLSGNALYVSADFGRDLRDRGDYRLWLDTYIKGTLARWSVLAADCTVAPSKSFASELRHWTGKDVMAIHHGFDREMFFGDQADLPQAVQTAFSETEGSLRLLFVSHYNYYRHFETVIRATAILKEQLHPRLVRLFLTCKLNSAENPGRYDANIAADLVRKLRLDEHVVQLGPIPYRSLHRLYRACDFYVTPAYAETFAHPLVEAMASGVPVIASDLAVHQEICGQAARYFPRFSPEALAGEVIRLSQSRAETAAMRDMGVLRSRDFSWDKHLDELLQLVRRLTGAGGRGV